MQKRTFRIGNESFEVEQIRDEWLVVVREHNGDPFLGDDGSEYEIRVVVRPGEIPETQMVVFEGHDEVHMLFSSDYYRNVAEAIVAGNGLIDVTLPDEIGEPVIVLHGDQDTADALGFDADTVQRLSEDTVLEILMWPTRRHAEFAARNYVQNQTYEYEDLDYNNLIKDLLEYELFGSGMKA